jgi:hypothetical protein
MVCYLLCMRRCCTPAGMKQSRERVRGEERSLFLVLFFFVLWLIDLIELARSVRKWNVCRNSSDCGRRIKGQFSNLYRRRMEMRRKSEEGRAQRERRDRRVWVDVNRVGSRFEACSLSSSASCCHPLRADLGAALWSWRWKRIKEGWCSRVAARCVERTARSHGVSRCCRPGKNAWQILHRRKMRGKVADGLYRQRWDCTASVRHE